METSVKILQKCSIRRYDILIFVTVGTPSYDFRRLVKAVDDIAAKGLNEKIMVQLGYTKYIPRNCDWFKFAKPEKMEEICKKSRVYISHGGIGSLMMPLKYKKPVIAVARLKEFGEHIDNHQLQIVKELEKQGKIIAVYNIDNLDNAIKKAGKMKIKYEKNENKIMGIIEKFLEGAQA
jgi:UDP-N-acetylglucosamine transferase subunit ALG13